MLGNEMISTAERFWSKVRKGEGCWLWQGWIDESGRGRFHLNGITRTAPKAAWLIEKGPIPLGLEVLHSCDTPQCCRLDHLSLGTKFENMQQMAARGRCGIQQHPERYKRERKDTTKYRPVKQSLTPAGIDHRTWTRLATREERELAKWGLSELETQFNKIALVPAPTQRYPSQKIRVIESSNPGWYREFYASHKMVQRKRIIKALVRVAVKGRVRGNGYEKELLGHLKNWNEERVYGQESSFTSIQSSVV